eukprot:scaffold7052_cov254-Pinguiococcus_pyrenoidosus.AAC.90
MDSLSRLFGPPAAAPVLQPAKGASSVLPEKPAFRDALYAASYDVVTGKVRGCVGGTKALAQFLVDLAGVEEAYGNANLKLSKRYSLNLEFQVDEKGAHSQSFLSSCLCFLGETWNEEQKKNEKRGHRKKREGKRERERERERD